MSKKKKKKSGKQNLGLTILVLLTAILNLLKAILERIKSLLEQKDGKTTPILVHACV